MKATQLVLLCCLPLCLAVITLPRKQLAGLPAEFSDREIPNPIAGAVNERSAFIYLDLTPSKTRKNVAEWSSPLPVDSSEVFAFTIYSIVEEHLDFKLTDPEGTEVNMKEHASTGFFPIGDYGISGTTYVFQSPKVGIWQLSAQSKEGEEIPTDGPVPEGGVILFNQSPLRAYSHVNSYNLQKGQRVGLVASVTEDDEITADKPATPKKGTITEAYMEVTLPDGKQEVVVMKDDGLNFDGEANDGVYGGSVQAEEVGTYTASAVLKGSNNGVNFIRSTEHVFPVAANEITLTGKAFSTVKDSSHISIHMEVEIPTPTENALFRAYTQVWGKDANQNDVAVCWLSAMVDPEEVSGVKVVTLILDTNWLVKAEAKGSLTLKNIFLQDAYVHVPLTQVASMQVSSDASVNAILRTLPTNSLLSITREMKVGVPPASFTNRTRRASSKNLLLVHGYCASGNPWTPYSQHFENAAYFSEPRANMNNQEFTDALVKFAESQQMDAYSVIGHSQGGMIGLHLLNYYFSPMDNVGSGRKIQSLGTPFLGCSGAGSAANLIKLFGYGCGANTDLTTDGARLWLSGIDQENRKHIYYYTTTYQLGNFFGDYCNMAVNLVLNWPNDGTSELDLSKLPGANNMGNVEKQCHTSDMKYPAQYSYTVRNQQMNANAAR